MTKNRLIKIYLQCIIFFFSFTLREKFRSAVKGISQKLLGHEMMLVNSVEVRDLLLYLISQKKRQSFLGGVAKGGVAYGCS